METSEMRAVMEAIIYVADDPVKKEHFQEVFPDESPESIKQALTEMVEAFNRREGGMQIREVAGGWRMTTRPEHHEHIRLYLKTRPSSKLSLAALETLAVIAYKQPVTQAEIQSIRGKKSNSSTLQTLLEKKLVSIQGRKQVVGKKWLRCFGQFSIGIKCNPAWFGRKPQSPQAVGRRGLRLSPVSLYPKKTPVEPVEKWESPAAFCGSFPLFHRLGS
jgi:segregation and condensation protein B